MPKGWELGEPDARRDAERIRRKAPRDYRHQTIVTTSRALRVTAGEKMQRHGTGRVHAGEGCNPRVPRRVGPSRGLRGVVPGLAIAAPAQASAELVLIPEASILIGLIALFLGLATHLWLFRVAYFSLKVRVFASSMKVMVFA